MHVLAGKSHRTITTSWWFICISFSHGENTCTIHAILSGYFVCRSVKLYINITGYVLSGLGQFCGYSQKFSPQILGVWHLWCCKSKQSAQVSCYTVYLACLSVVTKYVSYDTSFCWLTCAPLSMSLFTMRACCTWHAAITGVQPP